MVLITAYADTDKWQFIINTPDGTPETGSDENTVGFDDCGLYSTWYSKMSDLDKALDRYSDHTEYWRYEASNINSNIITKNGSLQLQGSYDLYVYDGVAYNGTTGAAYSHGKYFTVSWRQNSIDLSSISGLNPLSYVESFSFDESSEMKGTAASFYKLMVTLSLGGMVFSFIVAGIKVAYRGVKALKDDLIDVLGYKIIVFVALSAFVGLFGLFGEFIEALIKF